MAVSLGTPQLLVTSSSVSSMNEIVASGLTGARNHAERIRDNEKNSIEVQIARLKAREQVILSKLGYNSVEELQLAINSFNNSFVLSGSELGKRLVFPYQDEKNRERQLLQKAFDLLIQREFKKYLKTKDGEAFLKGIAQEEIKESYKKIANEVCKKLASKDKKRGFYTSTKLIQFNSESSPRFLLSRATKQQQNLWVRAIEQVFKNADDGVSEDIELVESFKKAGLNKKGFAQARIVFDDGATIDYRYVTDGKKASQIKLTKDGKLPQKYRKRIEELREVLVSMSGKAGPSIRMAFDKVYNTDPLAFFVGNSGAELTGLFGEIQALGFIYHFLTNGGKGNAVSWGDVEWIAKKYTNNGKSQNNPHADIILKDLNFAGIQVKNSISDEKAFTEVHFTELNMSNFFDRLHSYTAQNAITPESENALKQAYVNGYFNQVVKPIDGNWEYGKNETFEPQRNSIESNLQLANDVLSVFAAELMYLSTSAGLLKRNVADTANVLFILGTQVKLASQILEEATKGQKNQITNGKIESIPRFSVNGTTEKGNNYTIKHFYNENKGKIKFKEKYEQDFHYSGIIPAPDLTVLDKIKLQTAFNFKY